MFCSTYKFSFHRHCTIFLAQQYIFLYLDKRTELSLRKHERIQGVYKKTNSNQYKENGSNQLTHNYKSPYTSTSRKVWNLTRDQIVRPPIQKLYGRKGRSGSIAMDMVQECWFLVVFWSGKVCKRSYNFPSQLWWISFYIQYFDVCVMVGALSGLGYFGRKG